MKATSNVTGIAYRECERPLSVVQHSTGLWVGKTGCIPGKTGTIVRKTACLAIAAQCDRSCAVSLKRYRETVSGFIMAGKWGAMA